MFHSPQGHRAAVLRERVRLRGQVYVHRAVRVLRGQAQDGIRLLRERVRLRGLVYVR